jgi:hypothetical protein
MVESHECHHAFVIMVQRNKITVGAKLITAIEFRPKWI